MVYLQSVPSACFVTDLRDRLVVKRQMGAANTPVASNTICLVIHQSKTWMKCMVFALVDPHPNVLLFPVPIFTRHWAPVPAVVPQFARLQ